MAKTKISEFSTTAGNNTDINSINIAEGCAPSGINDAIRELMRQLKEFQTGGAGDSVNSGGDFSVATNKFTVASASGNTSVAGTLGVTGAATLSSTLAVTGTTTLTGALVANGNATLGDASGDTVTIKGTPTLEVNPTLSGGTANGVLYLNGSKVATSGSALTFDGSVLNATSSIQINSANYVGAPSFGVRYNASNSRIGFGIGNANGFPYIGYNTNNKNGSDTPTYDLAQAATQLRMDGGQFIFNYAGSGAAGADISWSEAMRVTSTGLGIGTSSPSVKLEVANTGGSVAARLRSSDSGYAELYFGDVSDGAASAISYEHSTNLLRFYNGGSVRATLDSSGNLGLGVTPSAWQAALGSVIQLGTGAAIVGDSGAGRLRSVANAYFNGTNWKYIADGYATYMYQNGGTGETSWQQAASGTAGNNITFTQAMTLDASGNLALGRTSASFRADVEGDFRFGNFVSGGTLNGYFGCANTGSITLNFGGTTTPTKGRILYSDNSDLFAFYTNSTERARIDSSGNFIHQVNGTAPTLSTNSTMSFELTSNTSLKIVVRGSDGTTRSATLTLA